MSKKKKIIPELRFPEFEKDGEWVEHILENVTEKIQDGTHFSPKSFDSGDFLYITSKNVKNGYIDLSTAQFVAKEDHDNIYQRCDVKQGDVLLTKDGTIGQACVNELAVPFSLLSSVAFIRLISNYSNYFLYHLLVSHLGQKEIKSQIAGQALRRITLTKIKNFKFSFPKFPEQQKIASCLSSLDELIAAHNHKLDALKDHKKGLLQNLFPQEGETVPKVRFPEFEGDGEWVEKTLSQVAEYVNGKAHEKDIDEDGKYIVVNSKFISSDGETVKYSDTAFCLAEKGDILMVLSDVPNGKAIAKCFYVDENDRYSVNQRICKIIASDCDKLFLFYTMDRNPYFLSFDDGVKQTNLRNSDVLEFPFRVPENPNEQIKISSCISAVDELITAQAEKIEQLQEHKKGLMQGMFPKIEN